MSNTYQITMISGITLNIERRSQLVSQFWEINPVEIFYKEGLSNVLALAAQDETSLFTSADSNILREFLLNTPGIGPSTSRSVLEAQVVTNNNTSMIVQNATRERDRQIIVLAPLIHVTSYFYAADRDSRIRFIQQAKIRGIKIPQHFAENFRRIRQSTAGIFEITPSINTRLWDVFLSTYPQCNNSVYDYNFLSTYSGITTVLDIFAKIQQSQGNYVVFVDPNEQNCPDWISGSTTTICGLTVDEKSSINLRKVFALTGLNYPKAEMTATHPADVSLVRAQYFNNLITNIPNTQSQYASVELLAQGSTIALVSYLVKRALGVISNPKNYSNTNFGTGPKDQPNNENGTQGKGNPNQSFSVPTDAANAVNKGRKGTPKPNGAISLQGNYITLSLPLTSSFASSLVQAITNGMSLSPRPRGRRKVK